MTSSHIDTPSTYPYDLPSPGIKAPSAYATPLGSSPTSMKPAPHLAWLRAFSNSSLAAE